MQENQMSSALEILSSNNLAGFMWAVALFLFIAILLRRLINSLLVGNLKILSKKTETKLDDLIANIFDSLNSVFYGILGLYAAAGLLALPVFLKTWISSSLFLVITFFTTRAIQKITFYLIKRQLDHKDSDGNADPSILSLLHVGLGIITWACAALVVFQRFQVNITGLVGGLGITGIAVAFALQNVLAEIFASLAIYLDKPFQTGDFIVVGKDLGMVQKIGIKSTRIKTLQGESLIISNKELSETRVNNLSEMKKRRVEFDIGVTYQTSNEKLREIPNIVERIIGNLEICSFRRATFKTFGDFSLIFEIVYFIDSGDLDTFMDIQQKVNLDIKSEFEKAGIEFAYPTQTLYTKSLESNWSIQPGDE